MLSVCILSVWALSCLSGPCLSGPCQSGPCPSGSCLSGRSLSGPHLSGWRTWFQHLKRHAKNFLKGKKKGDVCDICKQYDEVVRKRVLPLCERVRTDVEAVTGSYFKAFDRAWKLNAACPWEQSNPAYLAGFKKFVDTHRTRFRGVFFCQERTRERTRSALEGTPHCDPDRSDSELRRRRAAGTQV